MDANYNFGVNDIRNLLEDTDPFIDDRKIILTSEDPVIYVEEVNTELLTENFEIEIEMDEKRVQNGIKKIQNTTG